MFNSKFSILLSTLLITSALQAKTQLTIPPILDPNFNNNTETLEVTTFKRTGPTIQVAILLDTSNSMDGLINQTKTQIWKIINEISKANKNNEQVTIQVSLFEYGKQSIPNEEGYIRMLTPLTQDLDLISEQLFNLNTNGGDEYAGRVIKESINRLQWSNHKDDLKLILIAGNESFAQGDVSYQYAINKAVENNIIVNTIFCGDYQQGVRLLWQDGAIKGKGKYINIAQNDKIKYIHTPFDEDINHLSRKLNQTYIGYGERGAIAKKRQLKQDLMAKRAKSLTERSITKASAQYNAESWDIVSKFESNEEEAMKEISDGNVKEYKNKSPEEIKKELNQRKNERKDIQNRIKELNKKRAEYLKTQNTQEKKDIGTMLIKNIKEILKENDYKVEEK